MVLIQDSWCADCVHDNACKNLLPFPVKRMSNTVSSANTHCTRKCIYTCVFSNVSVLHEYYGQVAEYYRTCKWHFPLVT